MSKCVPNAKRFSWFSTVLGRVVETDVEVTSTAFRGVKVVASASSMNKGRKSAQTTDVSIVGFRFRNVIIVIGHFAQDIPVRKAS